MTQERWECAMACVLNNLGECLARVPEACICAKMTAAEYKQDLADLIGEVAREGER